eukprot:1007192-Pleurochrysis_carterae.AAC.3
MKGDSSKEGWKAFAQANSAHAKAHFSQPCFEFPSLLVGMKNVIPEVHKQAIRRHLDEYAASKAGDFYAGMGVKIAVVDKDGTGRDRWFQGAVLGSMVLVNERFPGGIAAWLPSLVYLIGKCKLEKRAKVSARAGVLLHCSPPLGTSSAHELQRSGPAQLRQPSAGSSTFPCPAASRSLQALMDKKYGSVLAGILLTILKVYGDYKT